MLYAAIGDIGAAVRANDAKTSAALVLHGLVFAGITTLVTRLGNTYQHASSLVQALGIGFLGVALGCFLRSVWCLISAARPYRPKGLEERIHQGYHHVFFPLDDIYDANDPHRLMVARLAAMNDDDVTAELAAETLKLGDILQHESRNTARGYYWLSWELVATTAFLIVAGLTSF